MLKGPSLQQYQLEMVTVKTSRQVGRKPCQCDIVGKSKSTASKSEAHFHTEYYLLKLG